MLQVVVCLFIVRTLGISEVSFKSYYFLNRNKEKKQEPEEEKRLDAKTEEEMSFHARREWSGGLIGQFFDR